MRILVAEDDAVAREHLCALLTQMRLPYEAHEDGAAAWKAFNERPARVVISDWDR